MERDPYQTLGISTTATLAQARAAYIMRVRVLHPDRFDPVTQGAEWDQANQMLMEVNAAWEAIQSAKASHSRPSGAPPFPRSAPESASPPTANQRSAASQPHPVPASRGQKPPRVFRDGLILIGVIGMAGVLWEIAGPSNGSPLVVQFPHSAPGAGVTVPIPRAAVVPAANFDGPIGTPSLSPSAAELSAPLAGDLQTPITKIRPGPPKPVHHYADSAGNVYEVSDEDYARLFPIRASLDEDGKKLDDRETASDALSAKIERDRFALDNTDINAVGAFNSEVDQYNGYHDRLKQDNDEFNVRVDAFNTELHRVGTLVEVVTPPSLPPAPASK